MPGQAKAGDGVGAGVAQQGGQEHRLARTVDAALGGGEQIERAGIRSAGDAAIGQVEGRPGDVEEGIVAVVRLGDQQLRGIAALAAGKAGGEVGATIGIGHRFAEDLVVDGDQPDPGAGHRRGAGRERADEGVDAVLPDHWSGRDR